MPRLQKLADQYKNRPEVMFLSLNMDENPGLIEAFLTEHKLTITVFPAYSYVTQTLKVTHPQNWIVGADGVIHLKGGIGSDSAEKWEIGMKDAIEKQKPAGGASTATSSGPGGL